MWKHACAIVVLATLSAWLFIANDHIRVQEIRVEVEDKHISQRSNNKEVAVVVYRRDDGYVFERRESFSQWISALPGERKTIKTTELEMNTTTYDAIRYAVIPLVTAGLTCIYLTMFLMWITFAVPPHKRKYV